MLRIRKATSKDVRACVGLMRALWPEVPAEELAEEVRQFVRARRQLLLVAEADSTLVGFVHAALRRDYVEGSQSSPVGYVEGLYVTPAHRKQGVARALVAQAAQWCADHGCTEMGSDTELHNEASQRFHRAIGFKEAGRIVCFIRPVSRGDT